MIKTKVVSDLTECRKQWDRFSPGKRIWDDWEYISELFDPEFHKLHFIVVEEGGVEIGLLPLMRTRKGVNYQFFGGSLPESRRFWFEPEHFALLFDEMPKTSLLFDIYGPDAMKVIDKFPKYKNHFSDAENRFFIRLDEIGHDIEAYKQRLSGDARKKMRSEMNRLVEKGVTWEWSDEILFDEFVNFSRKRFGNDSDFHDDETLVEAKRLLEKLQKEGKLHSQQIFLEKKLVGISMAGFYNGVLHVFYGASDRSIPNLGKLKWINNIHKAIDLKADEVDFMMGSPGCWKETWRMDKEECISFRR